MPLFSRISPACIKKKPYFGTKILEILDSAVKLTVILFLKLPRHFLFLILVDLSLAALYN